MDRDLVQEIIDEDREALVEMIKARARFRAADKELAESPVQREYNEAKKAYFDGMKPLEDKHYSEWSGVALVHDAMDRLHKEMRSELPPFLIAVMEYMEEKQGV